MTATKHIGKKKVVKGFALLRKWDGLKEHLVIAARDEQTLNDIQDEYWLRWMAGDFRTVPCTITYEL